MRKKVREDREETEIWKEGEIEILKKMIITVEILSYSNKCMFSAAILSYALSRSPKVLPPPHHCDTRHDTAFGSVQELSTYTLVFCQENQGDRFFVCHFLEQKLILKSTFKSH